MSSERNRQVTNLNSRYLDSNLYHEQPDFFQGKYYIHKHAINIGRMGDHPAVDDDYLTNVFNNYKYGVNATLSNTLTKQYMELINSSIHFSPFQYNLMREVFDVKNNNSVAILDRMQSVIQDGLSQYINSSNLEALLQIQSNINWSASQKKNKDAMQIQKLEKALNTKTGSYKSEDGLPFLDELLQAMADTVALLDSNLGNYLGVALANVQTKNYSSIKAYGRELNGAIEAFKDRHNGEIVDNKLLQEAFFQLQQITSRLQFMKNPDNDKKLSKDSLQGIVSKQFFPQMAEILSAEIKEAAKETALKVVANASRTGTESVPVQITDATGHYLDNHYFGGMGVKQGKADNIFRNVQLNLSSIQDDLSGEIKMDIGISQKSYVANDFGPDVLKKFNVFSLGGGMTLGNAFTLLLGNNNIYKKYLGYNIFAQGENALPKSLNALQDALLTRSIIYLAGGREKSDFAQFMLLNGQLLSVWDIVKYALGTDIGKNSSQQGEKSNGIYTSIPNSPKFMTFAKSRYWARRIIKTNESITSAVMKTHIVPKEIINYVSTLPELTK